MRVRQETVTLSATDLANHLSCRHLTGLNLSLAKGEIAEPSWEKELGLSISPKDPLLAQWLSQKELLEENAAEHQRLLSEFQAVIDRSQTAWSEQAKALAQQSLNATLLAARNSTASLLEEAARVNGAALRKAFEQG